MQVSVILSPAIFVRGEGSRFLDSSARETGLRMTTIKKLAHGLHGDYKIVL